MKNKQSQLNGFKTLIVGTIVSLTLFFCAPALKVSSDYDKKADFKQFKTFALYKSDAVSDAISALNQQRIIAAIREEMIKKGFQESTGSPDLFVNATAIFKNKIAVNSNTNYYGYGGMYRPYYWGGVGGSSSTTYNVQNYKDGSLIIDVIDAKTKSLLWEGTGNSEIDGPLKDPDAAIPKAIGKILEGFPPGSSK